MKPKLLTTIRDYSWRAFFGDTVAGVTVAMVALPLSIAIAIASGADPKTGLVTAIVGGLLISLLGGSKVQIGGPTGAFIVVVYGVIEQYGFDGLLLATLMAGVILVIGVISRFVSRTLPDWLYVVLLAALILPVWLDVAATAALRAASIAVSSAIRRAHVSVSMPMVATVSCPTCGRTCGSQRTHSQLAAWSGAVST